MARRTAKKRSGRMGITRISVRGFKSLADECSIDVRPLTILAGANSSGKSSMIQPLLLLKQTLESPYDPGPLRMDGPNVCFTHTHQLLSRHPSRRGISSFSVGVGLDNDQSVTSTFKKRAGSGFRFVETSYRWGDDVLELRSGLPRAEMVKRISKVRNHVWPSANAKRMRSGGWTVVRNQCFLEIGIQSADSEPLFRTACGNAAASSIRGLIHVPGLRGNPARTYPVTSVGPEYAGVFQNYVANVINEWQKSGDDVLDALGQNTRDLGLTWKVSAARIDDAQMELLVGRMAQPTRGLKDLVNIADVGFGVSQVLPVLVALLVAEPGQIVYLEQPEIHLHPKAQVALAGILADAANRGVRVVAETHSALLLLGIQRAVAEGELAPDKVSLNWFQRRKKDGMTKVTGAELNEAGAFGEWPVDFGEVTLAAQSKYLDAAEARLFGAAK